jgi:hypothetical protein
MNKFGTKAYAEEKKEFQKIVFVKQERIHILTRLVEAGNKPTVRLSGGANRRCRGSYEGRAGYRTNSRTSNVASARAH